MCQNQFFKCYTGDISLNGIPQLGRSPESNDDDQMKILVKNQIQNNRANIHKKLKTNF